MNKSTFGIMMVLIIFGILYVIIKHYIELFTSPVGALIAILAILGIFGCIVYICDGEI